MPGELTKFLEEREYAYRRLEDLLVRAERGALRRFSRDDLVEFGHLYRLAAADLARARYVLRSPLLAEYLNEIVGRAHHVIHRRRNRPLKSLAKFVAYEFPATVRREIGPVMLAALLLFGSALIGGIAYQIDPEWGQLLLSQPELRQYEQAVETSHESLLATSIDETLMAPASAYVITNNIRVCITSAAGGLLFGLGTLFSLLTNGFLLGVIGTMFLSRSQEFVTYFWAGILPHGVLELPAICISGGAGFLLARGLLVPGPLSRGDALRKEGRNAMKLIWGVILILIVAGLIEGFVTPLKASWLPPEVKIFSSIVLFGAFVWYLARSGYRVQQTEPEVAGLRTATRVRID